MRLVPQERFLGAAVLELIALERSSGVKLCLWILDGGPLAMSWAQRLGIAWDPKRPANHWTAHFLPQATGPGAPPNPETGAPLTSSERLCCMVMEGEQDAMAIDLAAFQRLAGVLDGN